ncbi:MAG: DUF4911 domain-containing protein [Byssovorax sp.]
MSDRSSTDPVACFSGGRGAALPGSTRAPQARRSREPLPIQIAAAGMLVRSVKVAAPDVVFVKGLLEASEGLGALFAERGGELWLVSPESRAEELSELLADLEVEIGATVGPISRLDTGSADADQLFVPAHLTP